MDELADVEGRLTRALEAARAESSGGRAALAGRLAATERSLEAIDDSLQTGLVRDDAARAGAVARIEKIEGRVSVLGEALQQRSEELAEAVARGSEGQSGLADRLDDVHAKLLDIYRGFARLDEDMVKGLARADATGVDIGANLANVWGILNELTAKVRAQPDGDEMRRRGERLDALAGSQEAVAEDLRRIDAALAVTRTEIGGVAEAHRTRLDALSADLAQLAARVGTLPGAERLEQLSLRTGGVEAAIATLTEQVRQFGDAYLELHKGFGRLDSDLVTELARQDAVLSELSHRAASTANDVASLHATVRGATEQFAKTAELMATASLLGADRNDLAGPQAVPVDLDFPGCLERAFPDAYAAAAAACDEVLRDVVKADLAALLPHWPNAAAFDWAGYVRLSLCRMVRVQEALSAEGGEGLNILDYGAFFGNFSVMAANAGHAVTAVDGYNGFGAGFAPFVRRLHRHKVKVLDTADEGFGLDGVADGQFDVVMAMSVIEHVPHTPRHLLETLHRVLKPGGLLLIETPNLGYVFNRMKLLRGESVWPAIAAQYRTEVPFAGHHREYTRAELRWMLEASGFAVESEELFNYSIYASSQHGERDLMLIRATELDPDQREIMLMRARKPAAA